MRAALFATALVLAPLAAHAVMPGEALPDAAMEARAREISRELRCLVCQNQSIDDSNAPLARDLRLLVRERLSAGDSNAQALSFITDRYGDYVLLRPPFKASTIALWAAPFTILALGGVATALFLRRKRVARDTAPLSDDEKRRLDALLAEDRP